MNCLTVIYDFILIDRNSLNRQICEQETERMIVEDLIPTSINDHQLSLEESNVNLEDRTTYVTNFSSQLITTALFVECKKGNASYL